MPIGKKACVQCERSCAPCIIKDDDERRKWVSDAKLTIVTDFSRPISRAYVYSLVERVALLEQMLEDQGLKVPPASYPPETRHHSRRSKGTSSADNASSFSSTPQESSVSDDHATSSPYCSYQDERLVKGAKKRSSVSISADLEGNRSNKRTRNDSLITLADVKVEPEVDNPLDSITPYDGTFGFGHAATVVASHQPPFWPMAYDHTGGLTALDPTPQDTNIEYSAFSAWCDNSFGYHEYSTHIVPTQYDERLPGPHHHDGNGLSRSFSTNLDFMPLGTGGSGT